MGTSAWTSSKFSSSIEFEFDSKSTSEFEFQTRKFLRVLAIFFEYSSFFEFFSRSLFAKNLHFQANLKKVRVSF